MKGIGVSAGVAVGRAVVLQQNPLAARFSIPPERIPDELARLEDAHDNSRRQLREIKARLALRRGAELAYLFDAQLLMLDDPMLVARAAGLIAAERVNAEWAVQRAFEDLVEIFDQVEDPYLRERRGDVADVVGRLRMNLRRGRSSARGLFEHIEPASVLVAHELTPSMAAQIDWGKILGLVAHTGSRTDHTAILVRSLHVPAVVGFVDATTRIAPGSVVAIDGTTGEVLVDPPAAVIDEWRDRSRRWARRERPFEAFQRAPAVTADAVQIHLYANIELPEDLAVARECGAEGIGLYRSEFLLATTPLEQLTENVQFETYRHMLEVMAPDPVTVRTFDVDEDQLVRWTYGGSASGLNQPEERSRGPLGLRAIRLSLTRRELFRTQLRALLRAAAYGRLRLIFPFVSGVEELREARAVLNEARAELLARGQRPPEIPVGVMIEIPSAAATADLLAQEADFFSIGTNDLIQYYLAVDRTDARVSHLYAPLHPAILRAIDNVVQAAQARQLPVALCGEMASDPVLLQLLIGFGLTEFSMNPPAVPTAKRILSRIRVSEMRKVAREVLKLATVAEIEQFVTAALGARPRNGSAASPGYPEGGSSEGPNGLPR